MIYIPSSSSPFDSEVITQLICDLLSKLIKDVFEENNCARHVKLYMEISRSSYIQINPNVHTDDELLYFGLKSKLEELINE